MIKLVGIQFIIFCYNFVSVFIGGDVSIFISDFKLFEFFLLVNAVKGLFVLSIF